MSVSAARDFARLLRLQRRGRRFEPVTAHNAKVQVNSGFLTGFEPRKCVRLLRVPHMFRKAIPNRACSVPTRTQWS